jgi:hypothetical protein
LTPVAPLFKTALPPPAIAPILQSPVVAAPSLERGHSCAPPS